MYRPTPTATYDFFIPPVNILPIKNLTFCRQDRGVWASNFSVCHGRQLHWGHRDENALLLMRSIKNALVQRSQGTVRWISKTEHPQSVKKPRVYKIVTAEIFRFDRDLACGEWKSFRIFWKPSKRVWEAYYKKEMKKKWSRTGISIDSDQTWILYIRC